MGRRKKDTAFSSYVDIVSSSYVPNQDYLNAQQSYIRTMDLKTNLASVDLTELFGLDDDDDGD